MNLFEQCVEYFQQPEFYRFIEAWIEKYRSLGHLGGKIKLDHLSLPEQETLGLLLGMDLTKGYLHITYNQFQKQWIKTKFENVDFLAVLKSLQSTPIYTKQEERNYKVLVETCFKQELLNTFHHTKAYEWLQFYFETERLISKYMRSYNSDYAKILTYVCQAINCFPIYNQRYELIPIFAQNITKDPHFFDSDLPKELLLKAIEYYFYDSPQERTLEKVNELFSQAGLLKDDLSNNCYICHIKPQEFLMSWEGFYQLYEPWNMTLYNLSQVQSLWKVADIYIVENPSVFRELVLYIKEYQLDIGCICSNGQINLCTYMLLDKLVESGCQLYYAGDYDPEGFMIADKLKQKYREHLILWCYDKKYLYMIAKKQKLISQKRLQILENISHPRLKEIVDEMLKIKSFGYQEGLIDIYKASISEQYGELKFNI